MLKEFNNQNFTEEVLNSDRPVVVDFWAQWCGPCKMVAPVLDELSADYDGRVTIGKVNVDHHPELAEQFSVRNIPTFLFIKNGVVVDKMMGAAPKKEFVKRLDKLVIA